MNNIKDNTNLSVDDRYYMHLAIEQARTALSLDEVPVGSVVTDISGNVIGYGYNQTISACDPTAHAEIVALKMVALTVGNYRLCDAHNICYYRAVYNVHGCNYSCKSRTVSLWCR